MNLNVNETSTSWQDAMDDNDLPKNNYTEKTIKLLLFSISLCNLLKFITQTCLYCSKQVETN